MVRSSDFRKASRPVRGHGGLQSGGAPRGGSLRRRNDAGRTHLHCGSNERCWSRAHSGRAGTGIAEAREYIQRSKRRHIGYRSIYQVGREVNPISLAELNRIVQVWADACLQLRDRDLKVMQRLVAAQDRLQGTPLAAE